MKRIYNHLFILLAAVAMIQAAPAAAQLYGNEWINYNNTYYKFKIGQSGIYRIPKSVLDAAGIPVTTAGTQFAIFRDGQEVPLYVSTNSAFGSSDYIEFYGTKTDGKLDLELYGDPRAQGNNRMSLFSDTAAYFLTWDNQVHARYTQSANNIPGTPPAPLASCNAISGQYYKNTFAIGQMCAPKSQFTSSQFSRGEGWINSYVSAYNVLTANLPAPGAIANGIAIFNGSVMGFSYDSSHKVKVYVNNQQVADSTFRPVDTKLFNLAIPASMLNSSSNEIKFALYNIGSPVYDYWGISFAELDYPRNFDISGASYFEFKLPYAATSQYIEISNYGGTAPRLYDMTNGQWYAANTSVAGKARFYLDPSTALGERKMVLYTTGSSNIYSLSNPKTIHFTDYTQAANQGNYLFITHKDLMQPVNGHNYVQEYKDYRASATGGGYTVQVADVTELYDQFAYGIDIHPLSIKHFLKYAYDNWTIKPAFAYLVGRGILYQKYPTYQASPATYPYSAIVPTYGDPGADIDFVNFGPDMKSTMSVGRLAAWNPQEIGNYLEKVKAYEAALKTASLPTTSTELWKKQILHIAGGSDINFQQLILLPTLNQGRDIIQDTSVGGLVTTITKGSTAQIDQVNNATVDSMLNSGLSVITFHGHASSGGFDYELNSPEDYHSAPRLPLFIALGCDVAQMFELIKQKTVSERYVESSTGGSIAMIAADNLNYSDVLQYYMRAIYTMIGKDHYGATMGEQYRYTYDALIGLNDTSNNYFLAHLESLLFQGDPALKLYAAPKPDYHVNNTGISSSPASITTFLDSFKLQIVSYNLGKAIKDTVQLKLEHTSPAGVKTTIGTYSIPNLYSTDTMRVSVPVNKLADLGLNKYTVTIDANNKYDEVSESNNTATYELFIYSDNLIPVYPQEFAIVNQQNLTLKASTLNPFRPVGRYRIEIDTTELFNSPSKLSTGITSPSGVIKWTPPITLQDSTVYYWRTAYDSAVNNNYQWSNSSFIYLAQGTPGWNQSHYYQYQKDAFTDITLHPDRRFRFNPVNTIVTVYNTIMYSSNDVNNSKVQLNYADKQRSGCYQNNSMQIMVFDSATGAMWPNTYQVTPYLNYASGANPPCIAGTRNLLSSEFPLVNASSRELARKLLDTIPDGNYILIKNVVYVPAGYVSAPASSWLTDSVTNGNGKSLYRSLKNYGFTMIDSIGSTPRSFYFMFRKNRNGIFPVHQDVSPADSTTKVLHEDFYLPVFGYQGMMASKTIGPAKSWQSLKWRTSNALDTFNTKDSAYVRIYGIDDNNNETSLYAGKTRDTSLSFIDSAIYHYIRLEWVASDSIIRSSPQLDYWRVLYAPAPEAALSPGAHFAWQDSLNTGQQASLSVAIENLTNIPMDSMLVKYRIVDANSTVHELGTKRYRKLPGNDTLYANFSFDPKAYPGTNVFYIEANPNNDQPEQYHPNNIGYLPLKIITDKQNPLVDVTFDGVHILDKDIVSAKPYIRILLKDENKYNALDDTSLLNVYIRYPHDGSNVRRRVAFDGTTCKFIPAALGNNGKNEAIIEYRPVLTEDSTYELYVNGRDKAGNDAGGVNKTDYQISFTVFNKPGITNVLNYPNPFSTATAFIFTLTGNEIPSQFKIQIMTVTGKVVREITKGELGPLHIGRNITQYKWDGRDQYGQLLGNGVYLYRVVTMLDGNQLEHRSNMDGGNTTNLVDKYFKNGYGKMYIMR